MGSRPSRTRGCPSPTTAEITRPPVKPPSAPGSPWLYLSVGSFPRTCGSWRDGETRERGALPPGGAPTSGLSPCVRSLRIQKLLCWIRTWSGTKDGCRTVFPVGDDGEELERDWQDPWPVSDDVRAEWGRRNTELYAGYCAMDTENDVRSTWKLVGECFPSPSRS